MLQFYWFLCVSFFGGRRTCEVTRKVGWEEAWVSGRLERKGNCVEYCNFIRKTATSFWHWNVLRYFTMICLWVFGVIFKALFFCLSTISHYLGMCFGVVSWYLIYECRWVTGEHADGWMIVYWWNLFPVWMKRKLEAFLLLHLLVRICCYI